MTLHDLFDHVTHNYWPLAIYFILLPLVAWVVGQVANGSRDIKFWGIIYAILVYAVCIPGIFAATLNVYLFFV